MNLESGHYKEVCSKCKEVQSQCRCMGPKQTRYVICTECAVKKAKKE